MSSKKPLVGLPVVVHDRGRPQAGRDVHPALITSVISEADGLVSVRVLPENGVDYPIKSIAYLHGPGYVEGLSWRFPEDSAKVNTDAGPASTPEPQATGTPTPGTHEPRNVAGQAVAKPGEPPNEAVGETSDVSGPGSEAAQADAAKADAEKGGGDDAFAGIGDDGKGTDAKAADDKAKGTDAKKK
jgi:hypothetical protein